MDILSGNELKSLMRQQLGICVSIYMPTIRKGTAIQQNQIRYKNLLRDAQDRLTASGELRPSEIREMLAPAQELLGNTPFWNNQSDGLALFLTPESFRYYRLPQSFEELVVIADRFHIKPLIPILVSDTEFSVLAISQKDVRFMRCSSQRVKEIEIPEIPENIDKALNLDDFEKRLQRHTGTADMKANILQYFKMVDKGLRDLLREKRFPLIFAGVDYLFPLYQEANTYTYLTDTWISGNPDGLTAEKLRDLARPIIEELFETKRDDALALYNQNAGTGLTSNNLAEIVREAHHGRVGTLFIPVGTQHWGTFDPATDTVTLAKGAEAGNEDLLDLAAIQTILNSGTVYPMNQDEMPGSAPVAALFRY